MAGTMNHLTRILEDMANANERLGIRLKEKSLTIVAGPSTEYKPGDVVEIVSNSGRRWVWRALGTWLDNRGCSEASMWHRISKANSMFYAKRALFCDPKLPCQSRCVLTPSIRRVCQLRSKVLVNGPSLSQCSKGCVFGSCENFVACFAYEGDQMSAGPKK